MITTVLIFIIILGILVFVHEFGHFIVARKSGMKVDEFGFGFPPRIVGIQKIDGNYKFVWGHKPPLDISKTVYSINWIPLGGFVKIVGENNDHAEDPQSFTNRPFLGRFLTLVAGVVMNAILAWVIVSIALMINLPSEVASVNQAPRHAVMSNPRIVVDSLLPDAPALKSGIMPGDVVLGIDQTNTPDVDSAISYIRAHPNQPMLMHIQRLDQKIDIHITPKNNDQNQNQGFIGASMAQVADIHYPWYYAFIEGLVAVYNQAWAIVKGVFGLIFGQVDLSNVGGPIAIAKLVGQARRLGIISLMQFTAFLSLNLAILNILPFPALDGGRVLFLLIEKVRGKKNNQRIEQWVNTVGFMFLILLMIVVTVKDVIK